MIENIDYQNDNLYIKHYSEIDNYQIGKEVDAFFSSRIGKWLIDEISSDERAAKDKLAIINPNDKDSISSLQLDIRVCTYAIRYLIYKLQEFKHLDARKEEI